MGDHDTPLSLGGRKLPVFGTPVPLLSVHLLLQAGKSPRFLEDEDWKKKDEGRGRSGGSDLAMGLER